jgi:hypothetical protein
MNPKVLKAFAVLGALACWVIALILVRDMALYAIDGGVLRGDLLSNLTLTLIGVAAVLALAWGGLKLFRLKF